MVDNGWYNGLENREYGRRDSPRWPRDTLHPQKLALNSPTSGGRLVGIVHSQTKATELRYVFYLVHDFSGTAFCLRFQVESAQLGKIDRARQLRDSDGSLFLLCCVCLYVVPSMG
jgi:hypothetical protein